MYGPWIEHNGNYVPHLAGRVVEVETIGDTEESRARFECTITSGRGPSWNWANYPIYHRVIRYRVKKPKGMEVLEGILTDLLPKSRQTDHAEDADDHVGPSFVERLR